MQELADRFGLIPYSDAVEEIDASELPGVETAFGITHATGEAEGPGGWPTHRQDAAARRGWDAHVPGRISNQKGYNLNVGISQAHAPCLPSLARGARTRLDE